MKYQNIMLYFFLINLSTVTKKNSPKKNNYHKLIISLNSSGTILLSLLFERIKVVHAHLKQQTLVKL